MKRSGFKLSFPLILLLFLLFILLIIITSALMAKKRSDLLRSVKTSISQADIDKDLDKDLSPKQISEKDLKDRVVATGVIRTSGLNSDEKKKTDLKYSTYQLTDLSGDYTDKEVRGYFLEGDDLFSKRYLGKCVKVEGRLVPEWEKTLQDFMKNDQYSYGNLAMIPENITPTEMKKCSPYKGASMALHDFAASSFSGVIRYQTRPAPDIGYDYMLFSDEGFVDPDLTGSDSARLDHIDLTPFNNEIWIKFEDNIGKSVTLEGFYLWGYSESKYLEVHSLK